MFSTSNASTQRGIHSAKHIVTLLLIQSFKVRVTKLGISSIAEQTNGWLGGYQAICREMHVDRYNFFLDEMVRHRNIMTKERLARTKQQPGIWPTL